MSVSIASRLWCLVLTYRLPGFIDHSQSSFNLGMGVSTSAFNVQGVPKCVPAFKLLSHPPVTPIRSIKARNASVCHGAAALSGSAAPV